MQREQIKPRLLDQDLCGVHLSENDDEDHDLAQPNIKFVSLKEQ
jgi:hypothetical protein